MSRLAVRLTGSLPLLLLAGSMAWSEPTAPASATSPAPAAPAPAAADARVNAAAPAAPAPIAADAKASAAAPTAGAANPAPKPTSAAAQLAQTPAPGDQPTPPATPPPAAPTTPAPAPAPSLNFSGFVDTYFEYNFNRPPKFITNAAGMKVPVPGGIENLLRNFDFKHDEFALNLAELVVKHNVGPVGLQVNFAYGKATDYIHAAEPGGNTYNHILQAFLTAPLKFWNKDDTIDAGIFVTSAGAEVIETKDNWNYTRSLLFAWAIPYYHAGLRYHHVINANSGLALELVNGWNDVEDNNNSLTYGASYNTNLTKKLPWVLTYYGGPELTNDNHNYRHLVDTVLTFNQSDKMAYVLNADYAHEDRDVGSVQWWGLAGYARRQLTARTAFVLRGEYFADSDGAATGTAQHVKEVTATYEIKGPAGLLTRLEGRYDWSNKGVFYNRNGGFKGNQPTLLLGEVYSF
jgi:putative OmpL-like beta-barrel porin-2